MHPHHPPRRARWQEASRAFHAVAYDGGVVALIGRAGGGAEAGRAAAAGDGRGRGDAMPPAVNDDG